jgi:DNA polymerase III epsilon subunit-like protein
METVQYMKSYKDRYLAWVDLETTGLDPQQHEIIEVGIVVYDHLNDQVLKEFDAKVKPTRLETASEEALAINGYAANPKAYKKGLRSTLIKLNNLMDGCILAGHNVPFDIAFLNKNLGDLGIKPKFDRRWIDTMSLAWAACYNNPLNGLSLKDLCDRFSISNVGAHSALTDCHRTLSAYKCLMGMLKT